MKFYKSCIWILKSKHFYCSIAIFLISILLLFIRAPDRVIHGYIWAEDAGVFLNQAYSLGYSSLFTPYAGYQCFFSRIIALSFAHLFSLRNMPYYLCFTTLFLSGVISVLTYLVALHVLEENHNKQIISFLMAISLFIIPDGNEVFLNITNLQWITAPLLLLLSINCFLKANCEVGIGYNICRSLGLLVLGINGIYIIFFAPIPLLLITFQFNRLTKSIFIPSGAYLIAFLTQLISLASKSPTSPIGSFPWYHIFKGHLFSQTLFGQLIFPRALLDTISSRGDQYLLWIPVIMILTLIPIAKHYRVAICVLIGLTVCFFVASVFRTYPIRMENFAPFIAGQRYFYLPSLFLFWSIIVAFFTAKLPFKLIPALLGLCMLFTSALSFSYRETEIWTIHKIENNKYSLTFPPGDSTIIDTSSIPQSD